MSALSPESVVSHYPHDTDDELAHYCWKDSELVALCGKKLRGIQCPEWWPVCQVCAVLADAFERFYDEEEVA